MEYKRILTVQDISCVGQCSLTVALPILSACGIETAIIPSAVLSNHTAFSGFTFRDLTDEIPVIKDEWLRQNIDFSAIYTGYLGNLKQVEYVKSIMAECLEKGAVKIVDPAMADGGKLYTGFDMAYAKEMKNLCKEADIILPNITEACLMTDTEYKTGLTKAYIEELVSKIRSFYNGKIVLTGVGFGESKTGVAVCDQNEIIYYEHEKIRGGCHGTGDVYASAFTGALISGKSLFDSAKIAADFTYKCIKETEPEHWYGVKFEPQIKNLIEMIK